MKVFIVVVLLLLGSSCLLGPASVKAQSEPSTFLKVAFYSGSSPFVQDGLNNTGTFCRPGRGGVALDDYTLVFNDMCGSGSAIRMINWAVDGSRISTLAGSLTSKGYVDATGSQARFQGYSGGNDFANGLTYANGALYLADTGNNAIRRINLSERSVTTYVNKSMAAGGVDIGKPAALTTFMSSSTTANLLVADTQYFRILYIPLDSTRVVIPEYATDTQPGWLTVSYSQDRVYVVSNGREIQGHPVLTAGTWTRYGDPDRMGYVSSLLLTQAQPPELLYFGNPNGVLGIYALQTNLNAQESASQSPTLRYRWDVSDNVVALINRVNTDSVTTNTNSNINLNADDNADGIFALTNRGLYVVSNSVIPEPTTTTTTTTATPSDNRNNITAAFPANAFPHCTKCVRSAAYAALFNDIADAFNSNDISLRFFDELNNSFVIFNNSNSVRRNCNISSDNSTDNSVAMILIFGPPNMTVATMEEALMRSNYTQTRELISEHICRDEDEGYFCYINCNTQCRTMSMRNFTCPNAPRSVGSKCDGLCKGAIAASTVLGVSGAGLLALLVLSPGTIFSALIMLPII